MRPHVFALSAMVGLALTTSLLAQDIAQLVRDLGDPADSRLRSSAYNQLRREDRGGKALPILLASLPSFSLSSQSLGFYLIQSYPPPVRSSGMRRLLSSESGYLRLCAASQLFKEGDRTQLAKIIEDLRSTDSEHERVMMLSRLRGIRDPLFIEQIRGLITADSGSNLLSGYLFLLLDAGDRGAIPVARRLIEAGDSSLDTRLICAAFLLAAGEPDASAVLATQLDKSSKLSLSTINRFLLAAEKLGKPTSLFLLRVLESDADSYQIRIALRLLGTHAYQPALGKIRLHLQSTNLSIAKAAQEALLGIAQELDPKVLQEMLASKEPAQVLLAADLLRRMDDHSGLAAVMNIAARPGDRQLEATEILAGFRIPAVVPALLNALESDNSRLRAIAFRALEEVLHSLFPYRNLELASTGYAHDGTVGQREAGLEKIRSFWNKHKR